MRVSCWWAAPVALFAVTAGCKKPDEPKVSGAWIRLAGAPGRPAAAYFSIRGGATDWTLVTVSTPAARRAELHETALMGQGSMGGMTMRPLGQIAVPAGGGVSFAPGGKHVMLFDVGAGVKPRDVVRMNFNFANGRNLVAQALVIAAGDPPPQR